MSFGVVLFGSGDRGCRCLEALRVADIEVSLVVSHADDGKNTRTFKEFAKKLGYTVISPTDPHSPEVIAQLGAQKADLFVLAGYGHILKKALIELPRVMTINLHGGWLPFYRGSSPMNWALIRGDKSFSVSVIQVDAGIDTGPVLAERTFPISDSDSIVQLHAIANEHFPKMLVEVVELVRSGTLSPRPQSNETAAYFPLRFANDGAILWDLLSAEEVHNRIRALTEPYPCAFTFYNRRKVKLLRSELMTEQVFGEPGRVYRLGKDGIVVCAKDRCLKILAARFDDDGVDLRSVIKRYDSLATMKAAALEIYGGQE